MIISKIGLREIDFEDEKFRISEELESEILERSLAEIGLVNPVCLLKSENERGIIICGFRRLYAIKQLGWQAVHARIWHCGELDPTKAFSMAIWDNLTHRRFSELETARIVDSLMYKFDMDGQELRERFLPLFDLPATRRAVETCLKLHHLQPALRILLSRGAITTSFGERVAGHSRQMQDRMGAVMKRIRLSTTLQRKVLDLVEEIAFMENVDPVSIFSRDEILEVLEDNRLNPQLRGEKIYSMLYMENNPRLCRAQKEFSATRRKLNLPKGVRLTPHPFLETSHIKVEFEVGSAEDFKSTSTAISKAAGSVELDNLFQAGAYKQ